jgi:arylsulfatase
LLLIKGKMLVTKGARENRSRPGIDPLFRSAAVAYRSKVVGVYFTAMEASLRAPLIVRWPGRVPAGTISNEIVHIVDLYPTLARVGGAEVPRDRPIDGVDQLDFFRGKQEKSNREGFPAYVADRLTAVKWRNWKMHLIRQDTMYDPPQRYPLSRIINLLTDHKEERDVGLQNTWVSFPMMKIVRDLEASLEEYPPIKAGTPDPYVPPAPAGHDRGGAKR